MIGKQLFNNHHGNRRDKTGTARNADNIITKVINLGIALAGDCNHRRMTRPAFLHIAECFGLTLDVGNNRHNRNVLFQQGNGTVL